MGTLTISNEFVNGTPADATKMNTNFTDITTVVNTGLTNENINAAAAIVESKIAFSASTGHTHDGIDSTLAALAVAGDGGATAGVQGTLKFKTGTITIADNSDGIVTFSEAFGSIPSIKVYHGLAISDEDIGRAADGYYIHDISATGFEIWNKLGSSSEFRWIAIGV